MSEARLELVETKQIRQFAFDIVVGALGMDESDMDDQAETSQMVDGWMGHWEKSRQVLSVPSEEMVEIAAATICDLDVDFGVKWDDLAGHYTDRLVESTRNEYRHAARAALTAAFNTLGIQEKVE
jgi:hypothetical protein